jgi:cell division protein FtsI (penicillin-binding protein 3)
MTASAPPRPPRTGQPRRRPPANPAAHDAPPRRQPARPNAPKPKAKANPKAKRQRQPQTPQRPPTRPRRPAGASPRRRLIGLLAVLVIAAVLVSLRLTQVQVLSNERYIAVGESQRVRKIDLPAMRGAIFDRDGRELALSVPRFTVTANPRLITDPLAVAQALAPILTMDVLHLQDLLSKDKAFVYIARRVPDEIANQIKDLQIPGLEFPTEPTRVLPGGDLAASLLGMVGTDNEGLSGLEIQHDKLLRGQPGFRIVEKDPTGADIPGSVRDAELSEQGDDLVLTIDRSLQYETERALAAQVLQANAKGGMAIVMHTRTGELLAMANLSVENGAVVPAAKNMTLTNVYEPGSVNKMITVSAALEENLVEPNTTITVPSTIKVADHVFKEHDFHPTEDWSITDIVANSSNVGSIMIGQKLGKDKLDRYMRDFGFGKKTGIEFPGESAGILLDPAKYSGTSMGTMPIGQGVAVTAVQMLAAYNTVANGGMYVAPKLVKATIDSEGDRHETGVSRRHRVISAQTAKEMTAMLAEVVRVGTATRAAVEGYTVAGKTGTARKPLEGQRGYKAGAYVSSFAGFVPAERPELSAIVILDEPTPIFGGLVAAPVFAQVARYALREFRIPPPDVPLAANVPQTSAKDAAGVGEVGADAAQPATVPPTPPKTP